MKILLTGGAGFIGSNLADEYIKMGHDVVIVDNFSNGKKENINKKAKFYKVDITSEELEQVFQKEKPKLVNHLAAFISVRESLKNPLPCVNTNVLGTIRLIELSKKYGVKKFIFSSTGGALYGNPKKLPADEKTEIKPLSPYGTSKYAAELFINPPGLRHCILRYSNVYGPRQDPLGEAGVVAIFTNKMLKNETPTINGSGEQTRDYVYVKDVVEANLKALEKEGTYNIGVTKETSVNKLFEELRKITGFEGEPRHSQEIVGEVSRISLDITKAKKELNWEPKYSLKEGLKETVEWARKN